VSGGERLTVAALDVLVGRLRGVAMRLTNAGADDDAAAVGRAANTLDHLSLRYVIHDPEPAGGTSRPNRGYMVTKPGVHSCCNSLSAGADDEATQ